MSLLDRPQEGIIDDGNLLRLAHRRRLFDDRRRWFLLGLGGFLVFPLLRRGHFNVFGDDVFRLAVGVVGGLAIGDLVVVLELK